MATRTESTGKCALCGASFSKRQMLRHLAQCAYPDGRNVAAVIQVRVDAAGTPYWLDLDVNATAPLGELDEFLRDIWLDCCDHLSAFDVGRERYSMAPMERSERGMEVRVSKSLPPVGEVFSYEYDFGSTTYLRLKVVAHRQAPSRRGTVRLLARNDAPAWKCAECGQEATALCSICFYEEDDFFFCELHTESHECGDERSLPVLNSPRMGVCAYGG